MNTKLAQNLGLEHSETEPKPTFGSVNLALKLSPEETQFFADLESARAALQLWIKSNDYAGYEPYDILNSPHLTGRWARVFPVNVLLIQVGKKFGGSFLRQILQVPASKNPKAIGLFLSGYADLARSGESNEEEVQYLKWELKRLRSSGEEFCCWGYDWDYYSVRGTKMLAFRPNCVSTCFCGRALLDIFEVFRDAEAKQMAESVGRFLNEHLPRTVDTTRHVCFSYTLDSRTTIYNSSALAGAFFARVGNLCARPEYLDTAKRAMQFLVDHQRPDGSWAYGSAASQRWIDGFHSGYNLAALLEYQEATGDDRFEDHLARGYEFYRRRLFAEDGAPKYFHNSLYPIDIHSCSQAILTFCAFRRRDAGALASAIQVARWTLKNMRNRDGSFFYQLHRLWTNRTPYMRWGQAWMFRALARLTVELQEMPLRSA